TTSFFICYFLSFR
ncbi:putative membrane protein, partial [Vibrio parahaemolyticus VPTS-2010]